MISFLVAIMASLSPALQPEPNATAGKLVVVNQFQHSVSVVDLTTEKVLGTVSVGVNGHEVVVSHDGRYAYVPIYSNVAVGQPGTNGDHVDVVDLREMKVDRSIPLGKAVRPHRALIGPDGLLYVSAELDNALYAVDTRSNKVVAHIPTGQRETHMFVISKDGRYAYTSNISDGSVSVLDLKKHELAKVIHIAGVIQRISMSVDGRRVFTHDQRTPRIAVIDTASNEVSQWIDTPAVAFASTPTPNGKWLLALSPGARQIYVVDLGTSKVSRTIALGSSPMSAVVSPDGALAYISCIGSGEIDVLDLKTWELQTPIRLSPGVDGLDWAR